MSIKGEWTTLAELREGAIFETESGARAVKSEYRYPYGGIECVLLASGEAAHFGGGSGGRTETARRHNATRVREIALPVAAADQLFGAVRAEREAIAKIADECARAPTMGDAAFLAAEIRARTTGQHPPLPERDAETDLEHRLLAAWRASGLSLAKLVVLAADAYALGTAVSLTGIVDKALVEMCERWVREHGAGEGERP